MPIYNHLREESIEYLGDNSSYSITIEREKISKDGRVELSLRSFLGNSLRKLQGASTGAAIFLTVNTALGAGLLNFSQAFDKAGGILVGLSVQSLLISFVVASLLILCRCCDITNSKSYQELILYFCGKRAHQICAVIVILYSYGTCLTFLIVIGDQFDRVLASVYGNDFCHVWYLSRYFTMTVSSILLILPMCFSKTINVLKYASSFGVFATLYIIILVVYEYFAAENVAELVIKTSPAYWTDVFYVIPAICFGYQCHISWVPTYAAMSERTRKTTFTVVFVSVAIIFAGYTTVSIFGYLTFGTKVASDIMESYDATKPAVLVGIAMLAAKTFTSYPVMLYCGREAVDEMYCKLRGFSNDQSAKNELTRRILIAILWFFTSLAIAVGIPDIGIAVQFLGSFSALLMFIFPGICLLRIVLGKHHSQISWKNRFDFVLAILNIVVGSCVFGQSLTQSIISYLKDSPTEIVHLCK